MYEPQYVNASSGKNPSPPWTDLNLLSPNKGDLMNGNSSSNPIDKWLTFSISHVGLYKNLTSSKSGFSE